MTASGVAATAAIVREVIRGFQQLTQCGSVTTTKALTTLRGQGSKGSQGCHQKV
jgi:hypothetical protein